MKILTLLSQKGGAGKTTIAVHLAVAAEEAGLPTIVLDLDPQASASSWKDVRNALGSASAPDVLATHPARLPQVLETVKKNGAKLAVIDTAPHSEAGTLTAAKASDFILVPCRPPPVHRKNPP